MPLLIVYDYINFLIVFNFGKTNFCPIKIGHKSILLNKEYTIFLIVIT